MLEISRDEGSRVCFSLIVLLFKRAYYLTTPIRFREYVVMVRWDQGPGSIDIRNFFTCFYNEHYHTILKIYHAIRHIVLQITKNYNTYSFKSVMHESGHKHTYPGADTVRDEEAPPIHQLEPGDPGFYSKKDR